MLEQHRHDNDLSDLIAHSFSISVCFSLALASSLDWGCDSRGGCPLTRCLLRHRKCVFLLLHLKLVDAEPERNGVGEVETGEWDEVEPDAGVEDLNQSVYNSAQLVQQRSFFEGFVDVLRWTLESFANVKFDKVVVISCRHHHTHCEVPIESVFVLRQFGRQPLQLFVFIV